MTDTQQSDYPAIAGLMEQLLRQRYSYLCIHKPEFEQAMQKLHAGITDIKDDEAFFSHAGKAIAAIPDPHLRLLWKGKASGYRLPERKSFDRNVARSYLETCAACGPLMHGTVGNVTCVASESLQSQYAKEHQQWLMQQEMRPNLIVDLRGNGGGSDSLLKPLASFALGNRKPDVAQYFRRRASTEDSEELGDYEPHFIERHKDNPGRNVIVLVGPQTMSSAESTALYFASIPGVKILGDVSAGSSGCPKAYLLDGPCAGELLEKLDDRYLHGATFGLNIPSWLNYLPDKTLLEGHGIIPHKLTPWDKTIQGGRDLVLEQALEELR